MVNVVVLIGRLGQDPELKYFDSGSVKARFSIAVDRNLSKENRQTDWFNIEAWGRLAEFSGEWLKKGQLVSVTASIEVQSWQDKTGNLRETCILKASDIRMEGSRRDNQQAGGQTAPGGYGNTGYAPAQQAGMAPAASFQQAPF
jgi:single-strand DNA-binding protein